MICWGRRLFVERMTCNQQFFDNPAANEVLVNDPFKRRRIARFVPRPLGIDERDGTTLANAKAVRLGAQNAAQLRQPELFQAALEKFPRRETPLFLAAFRVRLIAAQKNVAARHWDADTDRGKTLRFSHQSSVVGHQSQSSVSSLSR